MFVRLNDMSVYELAGDVEFYTKGRQRRVKFNTVRNINMDIPAKNVGLISKIQSTGIVNNTKP